MRCPSEQLCAVSAADRGADVQFAPEGFAPRWSLPSPFHGEEAKLPKGCGAFRTADQTISSHSVANIQFGRQQQQQQRGRAAAAEIS
jgi:hypothetical protein